MKEDRDKHLDFLGVSSPSMGDSISETYG